MQGSEATEELSQETEAPTQRLAFDKDTTTEEEVPQLRKARKPRAEVADPEWRTEATEAEDAPVDSPVKSGDKVLNEAALQNLAELSIAQLRQQQAELERKIQEKEKADKSNVIAEISRVMSEYNVSLEELVESFGGLKFKRKGVKAKAKYRDPATGTTWSGRGKEPHWIKDRDRAAFEI